MSLILEALRKSEAERRRGEMPDLRAELPPPAAPRRASPRALPWIAALAALAAIVIATIVLLHPWSRVNAIAASPPVAVPAPDHSIRMQARPRPALVEKTRIAERTAPAPRPAPQAAGPAEAPVAESRPEARPPAAAVADATASPAPSIDAETAVNALPADLRKALPALQLSMHMWDPDPGKRFVILDGERHVEGDSVGPMRIRRIDAQGVLFDWQGRAVRLPLR